MFDSEYGLSAANSSVWGVVRYKLPDSRSLESFQLWSARALHWIPFRKTVLEKSASPLTGKSHGKVPTGVKIGADPVQLLPRLVPAVVKLRLAWNVVGKELSTLVEMLLGRFVFRKLINWADGIWAGKATPTPERRTSAEAKAKSLSLRMGPPKLPANSLRRKTGRSGWKTVRAFKWVSVWNQLKVP